MPSPAGFRSALSLTTLLAVAHLSSALSLSSLWSPELRSRKRGISRRADKNTTTIPAPIDIAPSQYWEGNDGPWSSFALQVGTAAQDVRVQISTASTFTWTIGASGCPAGYVDDCADSRGALFLSNESLTWVPNSIFSFDLEDNLGRDTTGNAGFDTVGLGWQGSGAPTALHSIVFSIADSQYWIGELGLNPRPTNFTTFTDPQLSLMQLLKNNNTIPSLSYGYTAGNQYRNDKVYGSLVLGGYDQNRFTHTNVTFPFYEDISRDLLVNVQAITTDSGATDLLPDGTFAAFIDSTVPEIWLPETACTAFETAFNLTWNTDYSRYLVNSSQHAQLTAAAPEVTFVLSPSATGDESAVSVTLPYGAFDLQVQFPIVENPNSSYYFPLMRAANDTQYTLGRTFLQEAYLIADYERSNFTVAPCQWDATTLSSSDLISILTVNETLAEDKSGSSGGISGGAIGGVVVGIVAVIAILAAILWFLRRRKQGAKKRIAELEAKEAEGAAMDSHDSNNEQKPFISAPIGGELGGGEIHELNAPYKQQAQELDSPYKLDPNKAGYSEMDGGGEYFGPGKGFAHEMPGSQQPIFEMQGSDVHEMPSHEAERQVK
ncbi:hypothetical protein LTR36_001637 [Oleoguttula mirabilis]|uniref:Peptidase A1 domain-containing protein n=1 Tax=Oleoguttula mirabilis TaxID=1507867 RepID=A0AAV9JPG3_9PEZI|nr:hypothetical protein LTR36_001637 [Oleoguttula mirabilis]